MNNERLAAIQRVIVKRRARGANDQDIERFLKGIAQNTKNEEFQQRVLSLK